jgi:hypothetical protein
MGKRFRNLRKGFGIREDRNIPLFCNNQEKVNYLPITVGALKN